ncbi:MAG: sulfotransferase domain-containing protein [Xanthobacteraceae bacterium]
MLDDLGIEAEYTHAGAEHKVPIHFSALTTAEADKYGRIVFLSRDPRDTVVSAFHQARWRDRNRYRDGISEFVRDPIFGIQKIVHFNRLWSELAAQRTDILSTTYEELHAGTLAVLSRVISHFGEVRSQAEMQSAIAHNEFAKVREREMAGDFDKKYRGRLGLTEPGEPNSLKCRRGEIGSYLDELSSADIAYCNDTIRISRSNRSPPPRGDSLPVNHSGSLPHPSARR